MTFEGLLKQECEFLKNIYVFIDYEQCTYRSYTKLTAQIKPDMEACNKQKEELYVYYHWYDKLLYLCEHLFIFLGVMIIMQQ